jgi:hypothetical protein
MVAQVNQGSGYRNTMHSPCQVKGVDFPCPATVQPCKIVQSCNAPLQR